MTVHTVHILLVCSELDAGSAVKIMKGDLSIPSSTDYVRIGDNKATDIFLMTQKHCKGSFVKSATISTKLVCSDFFGLSKI